MGILILIGLLVALLLPFLLWAVWTDSGIPRASQEFRYGTAEDSAGIDSADSGG